MNKLYYGIWQELFGLPWPVRLAIEWIVFALILFLGIKLLGKICKLLKVKSFLVIVVVSLITRVLPLIRRGRDWAYQADKRVTEWGKIQKDKPFKVGRKAKKIILICVCFLFFLAILPDLSIRNILDDSLVQKVSFLKDGLQYWEKTTSSGYLEYKPIFPVKETKEERKWVDLVRCD